MEKQKKLESHFERRNRDKDCEKLGEIKCRRYVPKQSLVNDVVVNDYVEESFKPNENFKNFKCSDFLIENIEAAGAFDLLRPCPSIGQPDVDNTVDTMVKQIDSIINTPNNE